MTRAALYIRVSTAEQVEQYGLASQVTALLKRVEERQCTLVRDADKQTFMDDGYSGGDMSRPALDRLRTAVREGKVDTVLCYDPDRLSRNLSDLLLLANEIEAAGAHADERPYRRA